MKCRNFISINPVREIETPEERIPLPETLTDYLTGHEIPFSNRDNIRQKLVRVLIEEKGYLREDLRIDREIRFGYEGQQVCSLVDISVALQDKTYIIFKCAPGSVVSRERQIIAAARLLEEYVIPFAVITNGVDIELLDSVSENVLGEGLQSIPLRRELLERAKNLLFQPVNKRKLFHEQSILYTYDSMSCTLYLQSGGHK